MPLPTLSMPRRSAVVGVWMVHWACRVSGAAAAEGEEEGGDAHDESLPQGLKPFAGADVNGTAEAVPLRV